MTSFDPPSSMSRRNTLKAAACLTAAGIVGSFSGAASAFNATPNAAAKSNAQILHCKLISQPGFARAYLLIDNQGKTNVSLRSFHSEIIHFGNTTVNLEDAFTSEPLLLRPQQNAMSEIYLEPHLNSKPVADSAHYLDNSTTHLAEGTRVVSFSIFVESNVASIADIAMA